MRSALQALTGRTVKVCVTVLTVHGATTSMEAACASRASVGHTAGTGCVHKANMACTVSAPVSARTNTHSGEKGHLMSKSLTLLLNLSWWGNFLLHHPCFWCVEYGDVMLFQPERSNPP